MGASFRPRRFFGAYRRGGERALEPVQSVHNLPASWRRGTAAPGNRECRDTHGRAGWSDVQHRWVGCPAIALNQPDASSSAAATRAADRSRRDGPRWSAGSAMAALGTLGQIALVQPHHPGCCRQHRSRFGVARLTLSTPLRALRRAHHHLSTANARC